MTSGPQRPSWRHFFSGDMALYACLLLLCFFRIGEMHLADMDDITHAAMGKSILQIGDWFTMHEGHVMSHIKPPLYFWIEAITFKIFGATDYWARFPAALTGFLALVFGYRLIRDNWDRHTAFLATLILCSSTFFVKYCRRAMLDIPAAFALCLGLWAAMEAVRREDARWLLLCGVSAALGYYFKAVQGLYILGILPLYYLAARRPAAIFNKWLLLGGLAGAGLIAAWAVPQYLTHGDTFLYSQSAIGPIVAGGIASKHNAFYIPVIKAFGIFWLMPFTVLGAAMYRRLVPSGGKGDDLKLLMLVWLVSLLAVLGASSAFYLRYLIPLFIPMAFFAAAALQRLFSRLRDEQSRAPLTALFAIGLLVFSVLPLPTDSGYSRYITLYRSINSVVPEESQVWLYKDKSYRFIQGLAFYSDRRLWKQLNSLEELRASAAEDPGAAIIVPSAYFDEVDAAGTGLVKIAVDKDWRLYSFKRNLIEGQK